MHAHVRKPFRFLLCGDPGLIAQMRALLLSGHNEGTIPDDAAACIETIVPNAPLITAPSEVRAVIFLGQAGDRDGAAFEPLRALRVPIFALTVDPNATRRRAAGDARARNDRRLSRSPHSTVEALRPRLFVHLVDACKGVEIAVGRRLPPLRETVAAKLTRDAANNALKVALASALVDHIPVVGVVLGAFASAGDMVAITGLQMMLLLQIEAAYGRDPDVQRMWKLLPVIGGGFGWRTLARELVGFVPVAGVAIKGAIAYAGTIVVGEGVTFFLEHGKHMSKRQAASIYDRTKDDAMRFAREMIGRLRRKS